MIALKMAIFDRDPEDWRALQEMTGQLFAEVECEVEIGKKLAILRGTKEIDVYARDRHAVPPAAYLCECKFWKRAVPQEVVHAFRTVVSDAGAHRGFIISSAGFQQGAFEAARNTNTDLVTFTQLQEMFFDRWRVAMGERFTPYADRLFPYWDFPGRMPRFKWRKDHVQRQRQLMEAYQPLIHLGPLARMQHFVSTFPIVLPAVDPCGMFHGEVRINSYRQLYDFIDANKDVALHHFQVLHGEVAPDAIAGGYDPK